VKKNLLQFQGITFLARPV